VKKDDPALRDVAVVHFMVRDQAGFGRSFTLHGELRMRGGNLLVGIAEERRDDYLKSSELMSTDRIFG